MFYSIQQMADMTAFGDSSCQNVPYDMSLTKSPYAESPNGSRYVRSGTKETTFPNNTEHFGVGSHGESVSKNSNSSVDETPEDARLSFPLDKHHDTRDVTFNGVTLRLMNASLWEKFSKIGTEMIITKKGRRLFPVPTFTFEGLEPHKLYNIRLTILPVDDMIHRYLPGGWLPHREGGGGGLAMNASTNTYLHPSSPNTGKFWMEEAVVFSALKICNVNINGSSGKIVLQSMRKYRMTIVIKELGSTSGFSFPMELTDFVAVTQYQNDLVTKLKIEHNPFANAFRGSHKTKDKKGGTSVPREQELSPKKQAYFPILPAPHPAFLSTQPEYKLPFPDPRDYDFNSGKSIQSPYLLAEYGQGSRYRSNDHQVNEGFPHHGDFPYSNYRTQLNFDFASRSPQSALSVPSGHQSEFPISRGDPMEDVMQLNEDRHRAGQKRLKMDAISFIRKRRSEPDHESGFSKGRDEASPKKMPQSFQSNGKITDSMNLDSRNSNNNYLNDRLRAGYHTPDSDTDMVVDKKLEGERFDLNSQWSDEPREPAEEVPTDMTVKKRKSHMEGSPGSYHNSVSRWSPKARRPEVVLKNRDIWCTTNEVIVSAEGRPMFPFISLSVSGMEPRRLYYMGLEITSASPWLHNYSDHEWRPCMTSTTEHRVTLYQHPENPKYGLGWAEGVHFDRLRLSTTRQGKNMLKVQLRRQYYPVLIIRTDGQKWRYVLKDAMFITVSIDRMPLLFRQNEVYPADNQGYQQDEYPKSHSTQRKQSNPRKMKSSPARRYASLASTATGVQDLSGSVLGVRGSTEDATSISYERALQGHDAGLLSHEEPRVYSIEQSPPSMYSPDIEPDSKF